MVGKRRVSRRRRSLAHANVFSIPAPRGRPPRATPQTPRVILFLICSNLSDVSSECSSAVLSTAVRSDLAVFTYTLCAMHQSELRYPPPSLNSGGLSGLSSWHFVTVCKRSHFHSVKVHLTHTRQPAASILLHMMLCLLNSNSLTWFLKSSSD